MKRVATFSTLLVVLGNLGSAGAQNRVQTGTLVCNTSVDIGVIVGSQEGLSCTFTPALPGPIEFYSGTITKLGLDLGSTSRAVIVWLVYAPTSRRIGELAGTYAGVGAEATFVSGLGANVLAGGSNQSVALQPVSVQEQSSVNLAAGFEELQLRFVR